MWQIVGQERNVALLRRGLAAGQLAPAYLFVGPPHIGKMALALELARALNCRAAEPPCGECASCRKITGRNHADVQIVSLQPGEDSAEAKLISTGQIEQLQRAASLPPFEGEHKVFIIDGAELLSHEAANRLLKTLEEPVGRVVFLLLTVNDRLLLPTVVSRCQRLEFRPVPARAIEAELAGRGIEPEKASLLARLSRGCPGWALAALQDDGLLHQRQEMLDRIEVVMAADIEERFAYAARLAGQFSQSRGAVYQELEGWRDYWRDLMLVKAGRGDIINNIDRRQAISAGAEGYRLADIREFMEGIRAAARQLSQNVNPQLALEVLMLDIPKKESGGAVRAAPAAGDRQHG